MTYNYVDLKKSVSQSFVFIFKMENIKIDYIITELCIIILRYFSCRWFVGVMVIVIDSNAVNCGFHITVIKLTICCLPIKNALILRKRKYVLFRGKNNVSEWSYIPIWTVVSLSYHYENSVE